MFEGQPSDDLVRGLSEAAAHGCSMAERVHRIGAWERVLHWARAMQALEVSALAAGRILLDEAAGAPPAEAGKYVAAPT